MKMLLFLRCLLSAACGLGALLAWGAAASAADTTTLEAIRARGHLLCGIGEPQAGFSHVAPGGERSGLDAEFCTALAAAVFGSKDAVKFWPLSANDRFKALQAGDVDVLARGATWTLSRDTELGARFAGVLFYDGQGFLTRRGNAVASVLELSGASICALPGAMGEQAVAEYFAAQRMRYQIVAQDNWDDLVKAYNAGSCTVLTGDVSLLAQARSKLKAPGDHIILPELITKEPLGPAVRQDDAQWFAVVRWTLMALIEAEELGLTSANVDAQRASTDRRHPPLSGARGKPRPGTGAAARLGISGGQERRQLRRDFRAHARHEVRPEAGARAQQLVDQGRADVFDALPLRDRA